MRRGTEIVENLACDGALVGEVSRDTAGTAPTKLTAFHLIAQISGPRLRQPV